MLSLLNIAYPDCGAFGLSMGRSSTRVWRKWVAVLCVALMAALFMQEADATEHALSETSQYNEISLGEGVVMHVHGGDADHHDDALPDHDGAAPHAHQCLCVHAANLATASDVGLHHSSEILAGFTLPIQTRAVRRGYALERPPKASASV